MAKDLFNKNDLIILGIIFFLIIILYFNKTENFDNMNSNASGNVSIIRKIKLDNLSNNNTESNIATEGAKKPNAKKPSAKKPSAKIPDNSFKSEVCNLCKKLKHYNLGLISNNNLEKKYNDLVKEYNELIPNDQPELPILANGSIDNL